MTDIDIATAALTADEARALTGEIRQRLDGLLPLIKRAFEGRADMALGYESWQAYCAAELNDVRVPLADRPTMVAELRAAGMSTRAIGSALGVDAKTVRNDLSTGEFSPVAPERITSLDGRERPATRPQTPAPFPGPETEAAGTSTPAASVHNLPAADEVAADARRDAELAAELANTATRFRANFSATVARADDLWQFDVDRIVEVYGVDYDRAVRPFLEEMTRWIERVEQARRRQTSGLRVVSGGAR